MIDSPMLIPIAALGLAATIQYFLGVKQNRWLGKAMSVQAEDTLKPKDTNYVNIGGAIGYNFVYKLREPWKEVKGSFTFFPRHSLLYMPFSLLIGNSDRFFINLFTDRRLAGEGHIIEKGHLRRTKIDGLDKMEQEVVQLAGRTFILLWHKKDKEDLNIALRRTLEAMPDPISLSHFCCFDDNKTFFLYLKPRKGKIEDNLKKFLELCPEYFR